METNEAVKALAALAQESRLAIFRLLVEQRLVGLPAPAIKEKLGLVDAALSFHLKELISAALIDERQEHGVAYYAVSYHTMNGLVNYITVAPPPSH
jgi:ArsR family transcriptional regulator